jgi:localization factor PodJL
MAREAAKDLARRSGMSLGEWLNHVILEDGAVDERAVLAPRAPADRRPASTSRPVYRPAETPAASRNEIHRVTETLDALASRIEAAESRTASIVAGVNQSVSALVARLDGSQSDGPINSARVESLAEVFDDDRSGPFEGLCERLDATAEDRADPVEDVVARIAERLEQAESRTTEAIRGLETSFGHLESRLRAAETRLEDQAPGDGLEQIAAGLSASLEAARAEMTDRIQISAEGRFERMERALQEMTSHVQAAERQSAGALERMGHEVLRVAETLGRQVQDVDRRSAGAVEQVGGEVARIADTMDIRFNRVDAVSAQALERLGGEIARITERLVERIANAERRSAQAIDDVGDQVTRVAGRLRERQERVSTDLADRIRQSEERTAQILADARARIDQRLEESHGRATGPDAFAPPGPRAPAESEAVDIGLAGPGAGDPADGETVSPDAVFGPARFGASEPAEPMSSELDLLRPAAINSAANPFGELEQSTFAPSRFDDPDSNLFEPEPVVPEAFAQVSLPDAEPFGDELEDPAPPSSDLGEPRAARVSRSRFEREFDDQSLFDDPSSFGRAVADALAVPQRDPKAREPIDQSRSAPDGGEPGRLSFAIPGLAGARKPRRGQTSGLGAALIISAGAAMLGLGAAGYILVSGHPSGAGPARAIAARDGRSPAGHPAAESPAQPAAADPMAAVALAPQPAEEAAEPTASLTGSAVAAGSGGDLYGQAVRRIEARDFTGLDPLRKAANLGYPPAQFYLAKLYETGEAGLTKDMAEARRWTQRAAEAGEAKAMHNLALYYVEGSGGPKNTTTAAQWFRRAAELGLVDSQYNLGRLYEEGFGVSQNPAEAYKWYLIAGRAGDVESRASAQRLKGQLSVEAQAAAERAAGGSQAQLALQSVQAAKGGDTAIAQRALSRLGYYQGPMDGGLSLTLRTAIAAYQRDQGLPATGAADAALNQRLAVVAQ